MLCKHNVDYWDTNCLEMCTDKLHRSSHIVIDRETLQMTNKTNIRYNNNELFNLKIPNYTVVMLLLQQKQKVISEEQRKKYEDQYGEYQQKLETQREEFQKEHPEKKPVEEKVTKIVVESH